MPSDQQKPGHQRPNTTTECGHKCKDKESCGHACCKRHLSPELQHKAVQEVSHQSSLGLPECGHKCKDKIACGHRCCKRHLSQQELAKGRHEGSSVNLQVVPQAPRRSQHSTSNVNLQQVRRASSGPQLGVQGKSIAQAKLDPEARSSDATPSFHFFIYDIESTGFSPTGDRIVEIAMKESASLLEYATLVSCAPASVHRGAYQTHGISTKQSHEHGLPFKQVALQLVQFVKKCCTAREVPVLVAHNGRLFDNRMLTAEFKRCGSIIPVNWHWLDTLPLARSLLTELKTHSQADLREHFGLDAPAVTHRAAADVAILDEIVKGLAKSAGVASLQGLMELDGPHKGSFQDFAGVMPKEEQLAKVPS